MRVRGAAISMGVVPSPCHPMLGWLSMCGCFTQTASPAVIAQQFDIAVPSLFTPRYNIAPSQSRFQPVGSNVVGTQSKGGAT